MTPADLKKLLEPHGIRPIKGRSQHFLLDDAVVTAMCDAAKVGPESRVLEIGPGPGILTDELLRRGARVVAIELDHGLCTLLRARFGTDPRFTLLEGDALQTKNEDIKRLFDGQPYEIVANLPYAITSATLVKYLLEKPQPEALTIMIQREVADRIQGEAEKGTMNALALLVSTYCAVSRVREVPKAAFYPPPRVESAVIGLTRQDTAAFFGQVEPEFYFKVAQMAFGAPRKQLKNTLRGLQPDQKKLNDALKAAGLDPMVRPERVTLQEWLALAKQFRSER